jgi:hypothetical protein
VRMLVLRLRARRADPQDIGAAALAVAAHLLITRSLLVARSHLMLLFDANRTRVEGRSTAARGNRRHGQCCSCCHSLAMISTPSADIAFAGLHKAN